MCPDSIKSLGPPLVNYTYQYEYTSQNVLATYDFDLRFIFVVAGWLDSAHDT